MITMLIIALLLVQFTPRVVFAENEENVEISPTLMPSVTPTAVPTEQPESSPEGTPTAIPTDVPTATPTDTPIVTPTEQPEPSPEEIPIVTPTDIPTVTPADTPIVTPTEQPEPSPEETPIVTPTDIPAVIPTDIPTVTPTETPIVTPTEQPESSPEERPSVTPTIETPMISPTNALNEPQPDQENAYNFLFTPYSDNGDEPEVSCKYNVKIRYGDFNFSYNYGAQWNPETHRYEAGTAINSGWMSSDWNEYNCRIVIVNGVDSNYPLTVTVKSKIESGKLNSDANSRGAVVGVFTDTLSDFGTLISMDGKYMSGYLIVDDKYVEPTPITVDVNDTKHWDKESGEYIEELGKFCGLASGTPGNREYIKQIFFALSGVPDLDYKYGDANLFEPIGQISLVFKPATDGVEVYPKK